MKSEIKDLLDGLWAEEEEEYPVGVLEVECEFCGCSEFDPCEGGCSWSMKYLLLGRAVCTRCEQNILTLRVNLGALDLWRRGEIVSIL